MKLHFSKRATEVSTALRCLSCFLCFFPFTTVARGSSLWSLTCIPDRQKKSTQPVAVGEASSLPSSPAISVLKTPARSPPSSTRLQHRSKDHQAKTLRVLPSCSVPELPADGDTGPQLWSVSEPCTSAFWKHICCCGLNGWRNSQPLSCSSSSSIAEVACVITGGWIEPKWMFSLIACLISLQQTSQRVH